jgi:glycosyltransferase involved in cell wall biosynthesis
MSIKDEYPDLWIESNNRYFFNNEIIYLLDICDTVVIPYHKFTGSSGVLLWSAGAGVPVITQDYGLIGHWVKTKNLGLVTDTTKPDKLANAIFKMVNGEKLNFDKGKIKEFAKSHNPEIFAETIMKSFIK